MSQHWNFVFAAYGITFIAIAGMALRLIFNHRALKQKLSAMEAGDHRRDGHTP